MRAGRLDRRIMFERPVEIQDAAGEPTKQWQTLPGGVDWARKDELNGRELYQAQQVNAEVTTRFLLRWRTDVDARMRLVDQASETLYNIHAVMEGNKRRRELVLLCSRSAN